MNRLLSFAALCTLALCAGWTSMKGPPILCNSIDCGGVSIPESKGDSSKVLAAFLANEPSILGHMEGLRRYVLAVQGEKADAAQLMVALACRALDAESTDRKDAAAWFDLAFFAACLNEMQGDGMTRIMAEADGVRGYGYMKKALAVASASKDPREGEMQFGAALMVHPAMRQGHPMPEHPGQGTDLYDRHLRLAVASAPAGSLLEANLKAHLKRWGGSFETLKQAAK